MRNTLAATALVTVSSIVPAVAHAAPCDVAAVDHDDASLTAQTWGEAVARVRVIDGAGYCTATMVAPNLAITAGHCFETSHNPFFPTGTSLQSMCDGTTLQFEYQNEAGVLNGDGPEYDCVEILDQQYLPAPSGPHLDVAFVRVEGNPGIDHGMRPLDFSFPFDNGEQLTVVHHQDAGPKLVSTTTVHESLTVGGKSYVLHEASTDGGSSGAAILNDEGAVVAVHSGVFFAAAGCDSGNLAYSMARMRHEAVDSSAFEVAGGVQWIERPSGPVGGDRFGSAMIAADFNNDGADELVVHHRHGAQSDSGALTVFFGVPGQGLDLEGSIELHQLAGSAAEPGDRFGSVLTVGNFDGDAYLDLVAATPQEDWGNVDGSGHVVVFRGSAIGLVPFGAQGFWPSKWGVGIEAGAHFGTAVAAGDYNCDGRDDLAIGAPGTNENLGRVYIALSEGSGQLVPHADWDATELGTAAGPAPHWFGRTLAAGHLTSAVPPYSWACEDLVIGAPVDSPEGLFGAGSVSVVYGNSAGLSSPAVQSRVSPQPQVFAMFGAELAVGNLFSGPWDSLAIGSPLQGGVASGVGRVDLYRGGWVLTESLLALDETMADEPVTPSSWDHFGESMVFARTHDDSDRDQLVVAAPSYNSAGAVNGGLAIAVLGDGSSGIDGMPLVDPHGRSLSGVEAFGAAMAAGDFDGDGIEEVVVALPSDGVGGASSAGGVLVRHLRL